MLDSSAVALGDSLIVLEGSVLLEASLEVELDVSELMLDDSVELNSEEMLEGAEEV